MLLLQASIFQWLVPRSHTNHGGWESSGYRVASPQITAKGGAGGCEYYGCLIREGDARKGEVHSARGGRRSARGGTRHRDAREGRYGDDRIRRRSQLTDALIIWTRPLSPAALSQPPLSPRCPPSVV